MLGQRRRDGQAVAGGPAAAGRERAAFGQLVARLETERRGVGRTAADDRERACAGRSSRGIASNRAWVYGIRTCPNSRGAGACSTIRPAYITITSSAYAPARPRSWLISIRVMPSSACSSSSSSMIWAWVVTSSAVVASSAMSSRGRQASAIAIMTRCRIPPESWCGYSALRCSGSGMCTRRSRSTACFLASALLTS